MTPANRISDYLGVMFRRGQLTITIQIRKK